MDERTIELTKIIDAPADLVFRAFTEPEHLTRWWGPEGFGVASVTSDARQGGLFRIVMRGPDGMDLPVDGTYRTFDPPRRLVTESTAMGPDGEKLLEATATIDLVDADGKTELRLRASAIALVPEASPALAGMETGWAQSLRRLDDHLTGALDRRIVTTQIVEASPLEVFEVFTTPEHLGRWWGPDGFTTTTASMDFRPGGEWRFMMHGPDGTDYPNLITYEEIRPGELLSFLHSDGEEDGIAFRGEVWFDAMMDATVVTLKAVFATTAERDENVEKNGAEEGGRQTLARLAAYAKRDR
jgi:uncharacterized protein YndB with AHSA1/START domain